MAARTRLYLEMFSLSHWLSLLAGVCFVFIMYFVTAFFSPPAVSFYNYYAYGSCSKNHIWNANCADGIQLSTGETIDVFLPRLDARNRLFTVSMTPFLGMDTSGDFTGLLEVSFVLEGCEDEEAEVCNPLKTHRWIVMVCDDSDGSACSTVTLIDVLDISYRRYIVRQLGVLDGSGKSALGDVGISVATINPKFAEFQLAVKLTHQFVNTLALVVFAAHHLRKMRAGVRPRFESIAAFVLLFALLLFNDPVYIFRYLTPYLGFALLSSVGNAFFCAMLLWFILMVASPTFYGETRLSRRWLSSRYARFIHAYIAVYLTFTVVFALYWRIDEYLHPTLNLSRGDGTAQFLFFCVICGLILVICMSWLLFSTISLVKHHRDRESRGALVFYSAAAIFVLMFMSISLLFGQVGDFGMEPSAVLFLMACASFNVYVYVIVLGTLPHDTVEEDLEAVVPPVQSQPEPAPEDSIDNEQTPIVVDSTKRYGARDRADDDAEQMHGEL